MKVFTICFVMAVTLRGVAAPFQNLGFDEANTNNIVDSYGPIDEMLPGWRLFSISGEQTLIGYNASAIGGEWVTLYDSNIRGFDSPIPIEGKYLLGLYPGSFGEINAPFHLSQIGQVPADARTIRFRDLGGPFELRVNGELLPLIYEYPTNYSIPPPGQFSPIAIPVVGDVSQFSGQTVELDFITVSAISSLNAIDSILFSPETIPEPSAWALFGLGALGFLATPVGRRIRK
jgi:hypothetical protein